MSAEASPQSTPSLEQLTALLKLLADPTRLNILLLLVAGERNVTSLCEELKLPQPTVSHHLGLLRTSHVITNRRNGKQVFYALSSRVDHPTMPGEISIIGDTYTVRIAPRH
ncbi:MAG: metalloregulator ArsR/SmtB family transcription factor [Tepidisphaeraceae bacterium]